MTIEEFSIQFDILWNNSTSNRAPGLNEFEKSSYLTKAQNEIVKNYFDHNSKGNTIGKGFDDSTIRQIDFSNLVRSEELSRINSKPVIDHRALVYELPKHVLAIINEEIALKGGISTAPSKTVYYTWNEEYWSGNTVKESDADIKGTVSSVSELPTTNLVNGDVYAVTTVLNDSSTLDTRQVIPVSYSEYLRLMSKPFKEPLKRQAWRLISNGGVSNKVEIVLTSSDLAKYTVWNYIIRYVKKPNPIVLDNFDSEYSIEGVHVKTQCELNEAVHDAILQRAVELAKVAWEEDANQAQINLSSGQRSE